MRHLPWLRSGERIETSRSTCPSLIVWYLPWLRSGERIETLMSGAMLPSISAISLGFGQGSGLKHAVDGELITGMGISLGFGQGSGLKHLGLLYGQLDHPISLGFGQGSGLKHKSNGATVPSETDLPWLRSGERIETLEPVGDGIDHLDLPWLRSGERIETGPIPSWCRSGSRISLGFGQGSGLKRAAAACP